MKGLPTLVLICVLLLTLSVFGCFGTSAGSNETSSDAASPGGNGGGSESNSTDSSDSAAEGDDAHPDADNTLGNDTSDTGDANSESQSLTPDIPPNELHTITPGGDTICSRGTPFRYFVNGGTVNKVVVDFAGGGACWDKLTCSVAGAIFSEEAPDANLIEAAMEANLLSGIYDRENPDNPFKDWYLIHVPYCTGDVHWGNNTHDYGDDIVIEHKGFVNATAVLEWIFENFEAPEQIFVTGCSAGSYGAIVHSAFIAKHYENTEVAVLGDSGTGVITDTFFADSFPNWNAQASLPDWIPELAEADIFELDITDIYVEIANQFPQHRFSQYTTAFDSNQEFYYTAMGGEEENWNTTTVGYLESIRSQADNFRYYLMNGEVHCITPYDIFYTNAVDDTAFADWLHDFINGDEIPDDVACQGDDCFSDPVCDLCEETDGAAGIYCGFCN